MRELELFFGPQHMGMVGNFSIILKVEGDTILEARANPGFLHRGFEKLMELRNWVQNFPLVCRINVVEPHSMEVIYAMTVEKLADIEIPERAKYIRTIVLELSRIASHLFGAWGYFNMLGFETAANWAMYHRDLILDLFEDITGGRVYPIYIWPGGVRRDLPEGFDKKLENVLKEIEDKIEDYNSTVFHNYLFYKRAKGIAKISAEEVKELGGTGPLLRGSGVPFDIRKIDPYCAYDRVKFEVPVRDGGDSYSRVLVIRDEIVQSINIIRQCITDMPEGKAYTKVTNPFKWKIKKGETYQRVESSRGELGLYLVSNGGERPYRVHFRTPSYPHGLLILEKLLKGANIADVGHIMMSLYIIAPEIDR